jgi:hypothetical protein
LFSSDMALGTPTGMAVKVDGPASYRLTGAPHPDLVNDSNCIFPGDKDKLSFKNYVTKIYSQENNCGFQFILADGQETVAGSASDNMKCDVLPTERKVRKIITYQSNNREAMLVGIVFHDANDNVIYKSRYNRGFGSERQALTYEVAEDERIVGI